MQRIVVDARNVPLHSGIGKLLESMLMTRGAHDFILLRNIYDDEIESELLGRLAVFKTSLKRMSAFSFLLMPFFLRSKFGNQITYVSIDYVGIPFIFGQNSTTAIIVHDFMYRIIPLYFSKNTLLNLAMVKALDCVFYLSAMKSRIWFVSNTTYEDCPAVILPYVREHIVSPPYCFNENPTSVPINSQVIPVKYCLFIGSDRAQKGLELLVNAISPMQKIGLTLVVVGGGSLKNDSRFGECVFLSNLAIADYYGLLGKADCLIVPSLYEGYCIPISEALIYGVPVITSGAGALKEWMSPLCLTVDFKNIDYFIPDIAEHCAKFSCRSVDTKYSAELKRGFLTALSFIFRTDK